MEGKGDKSDVEKQVRRGEMEHGSVEKREYEIEGSNRKRKGEGERGVRKE